MAEAEKRFPERRKNRDRRNEPTSPFTKFSFKGSRRFNRRAEDREKNHFVDVYSWRSVFLIFLIINLSTLDAFLTLTLIEMGIVVEGNPVMAFFLNLGTIPFLFVKYVMTVTCALTILVLKNHSFKRGVVSGRKLILLSLFMYLGIILYELVLLWLG